MKQLLDVGPPVNKEVEFTSLEYLSALKCLLSDWRNFEGIVLRLV